MNSYKQSLYCGIVRVLANLIMVGAIFLAMYQAARWPGWPSEAVFCLFFFGVTAPAWIMAWAVTRWIRRRWPASMQTMVDLPRHGRQLVAWRVAERAVFAGRGPVSQTIAG